MSKKINNKTLLIVFLGLTALLVITKLVSSERSVRTLETDLVKIDTSEISSVHILPQAEQGEEIILVPEGGKWLVSKGDITGPADRNNIRYALDALVNLKTERLVARSEDKWEEYQVSDSAGTRVIIKEGRKTSLDLIIGRFNYQQPQGGYQGYNRNQVSGFSYVRRSDEAEVYAVEGFLSMNFNQAFNNWRDQTITGFHSAQVKKILFEYPADSGFIAQRSQPGWMVAGLPADSSSMAGYLNSIARRRGTDFEDGFAPLSAPDYQLTFEGDNMNPLNIRAYVQPGGIVVINSSLNPGSWFRSSMDGLFSELFKSAEDFLAGVNP